MLGTELTSLLQIEYGKKSLVIIAIYIMGQAKILGYCFLWKFYRD